MYTLATLHDLRQRLHLAEGDDAADAALRKALQNASRLVESLTGRRYCPHIESRQLAISIGDPGEIALPDDLLELRSLRCDGALIASSDFLRLPSDPDSPASLLMLKADSASHGGFAAGARLIIDGIWGWHDSWRNAWRESGDAVTGGLTAQADLLTVSDVAGADSVGDSPRFQVGQLLRIGGEYLRLIAIDSANSQLSVIRGVQGSLPLVHAADSPIAIYQPAAEIHELCLRYAELLLSAGVPVDDECQPMLRRLQRVTA